MLELRLLGPLEVLRDGAPVSLPRSKKTRALLAYLAAAGKPQRRERLCEIFWDIPDDPRGSLRWSLSKLRPAVNDAESERLVADRERVGFEGAGARIDLVEARSRQAEGWEQLTTAQLQALSDAFRGEFLEDLDLDAQPAYQAWCVAEREAARGVRREVLQALVARQADDPGAALMPARQLVEIDPFNDKARARLIELLVAAGNREEAVHHYEVGLKLLDELGAGPSGALEAARQSALQGTPPKAAPEAALPELKPSAHQNIRFCRAADGVRIAYATSGNGPPVVKTANWLNHLEHDWESPVWRHLFRALSERHTLIRYDERGNGLSDWDVDTLTFEAMVEDLETVVDETKLAKFPLLGVSQGCAVAIAYAVRHPERVSRLALVGGYLKGWRALGDPATTEVREAQLALIRAGWGRNYPAFRQMFTSIYIPNGTEEQVVWYNELQRISTSPQNAARLLEVLGDIDVTDIAPKVAVPTLVMHARNDAVIPSYCGRDIASAIPGAKFVSLDSENHLTLEHEPAWPRYCEELERFLGEEA